MNIDELTTMAQRPEVLLAGLALSVLVLVWLARRVRRIAKSERPDDALANLAMLIGLGWGSEAIWELTGRIPNFPAAVRVFLFFALEILLIVSMIRAKRHVRLYGWPGQPGTTTWIIAASMALVAAFVSHSVAEALFRLAIPLLLTKQWWDGLLDGLPKRPESVSSWRWTPRRLLLWLGAIEPGERDVETVHRERLTQTMTRLEFARRHGSDKKREWAAAKLSRLSLTADDTVIAEVRSRVDRAMWFETPAVSVSVSDSVAVPVFQYDRPVGPMPALQSGHEPATAVDAPADSVTVSVTDTRTVPVKRQPSSQSKVVAAHNRTPGASNEELAARLGLSVKTIERHRPPVSVNGRVPALVGAGSDEGQEG